MVITIIAILAGSIIPQIGKHQERTIIEGSNGDRFELVELRGHTFLKNIHEHDVMIHDPSCKHRDHKDD